MQFGHVLIDSTGQLLSLDQNFCDIMHSRPDRMIGRSVMEVTAPADREECGTAIARLRATHRPFKIAKRMIRDDDSLIWVTNTVSLMENGNDAGLMVATIEPMIEPSELRAPALLLDCAHILVKLRDDRTSIFDTSLFADTAWDAILAAYIAEAEGRSIDVTALAQRLGIPKARAERWIAVLLGQKAIEIETRETDPFAPKSFRLTGPTHARLEKHLSKASQLQLGLLGLSIPA